MPKRSVMDLSALRPATLLLVALFAGCSTQAVRCDGHLTPINVPRSAPADPAPDARSVGQTRTRRADRSSRAGITGAAELAMPAEQGRERKAAAAASRGSL